MARPWVLERRKPLQERYTAIDLFSGPGGMSTGFFMNGFNLIGAVDYEVGKPADGPGKLACNKTYARNLGVEPKFEDLFDLDPAAYMRELGLTQGQLTVMIACPPCTGFSQKNSNNHVVDDERNGLVEQTGLFVETFMPEWLVMENVKELLKGNHLHHWMNLWRQLKQLNYSVYADVWNLADFGVPQNRLRAIVVARRNNGPLPKLKKVARRPVTVQEAIGWLPRIPWDTRENDTHPMHICPGHDEMNQRRIRALQQPGASWRDLPQDLWIDSMRKAGRKEGSFPDIYGRLWWDKPAPTLTRECAHLGNGRYLHPEQDRLMSVMEAGILQGFPVDYYFEGPMTKKYNQIGDAVPPRFSYVLAAKIRKALDTGKVVQEAAEYVPPAGQATLPLQEA